MPTVIKFWMNVSLYLTRKGIHDQMLPASHRRHRLLPAFDNPAVWWSSGKNGAPTFKIKLVGIMVLRALAVWGVYGLKIEAVYIGGQL